MCPIKGHLPQAVYCLLQVIILFASIITCSNINVTGKIKISGNTQEKKKKKRKSLFYIYKPPLKYNIHKKDNNSRHHHEKKKKKNAKAVIPSNSVLKHHNTNIIHRDNPFYETVYLNHDLIYHL